MRTTLPISSGFYVSDSLPISAQRVVNWYPNVPQTSTITDANLFGTPGLKELAEGRVVDSCRGAHVISGIPYFVISQSLVRLNLIDNEFTTEVVGEIEGISRVYMSDNGLQLCITAPPDDATVGRSYIYEAGSLNEIVDPNFDGPAASNIYVSGYFMFHKSDGKKFFNSPLNNGLTGYDPLDFNVAEADPDQIRGLGVINDQLYIFGSETIQLFRNIGRAPSPFAPIVGAVINVGVSAPQTIAQFNGGLAFVGAAINESPAVWFVSGATQTKISTTAIDNELSKIDLDLGSDQIFSWVYAESGAYWLGISVPGTCFCYDLVNQRWHERQSIDGESLSRYRVSHMVAAYNRVLVGDIQTGVIGSIDDSIYLEYGVLIPRKVSSRPFDSTGNAVNVASIEAVVEAGVGLANDISIQTGTTELGEPVLGSGGIDPKITYSWSDDGGRTYEGFISRSMGKLGEYMTRPIWNRRGRFPRQRVVQFEVSSPTKATLIKVEADIG